MRFERLIATAGPDGKVRFEVAGTPGREYEVVVTVAEEPNAAGVYRTPTAEENGWPPGYFESTFGSIQDEAFDALLEHPPRPPGSP